MRWGDGGMRGVGSRPQVLDGGGIGLDPSSEERR